MKKKNVFIQLFAVVNIFVLAFFSVAQASTEIFIEIPTLVTGEPVYSVSSIARGINNHGVVVGDASADPNLGEAAPFHAFIWTDSNSNGQAEQSEMIDLGTLPGATWWDFSSWGYGINDGRNVVGVSNYTPDFELSMHAFRWVDANLSGGPDPNEMVDLGTLGGENSAAISINNRGTIVGCSDIAAEINHAFMYAAGDVMVDLGCLPGANWSVAYDISDDCVVVGDSTIEPAPTFQVHACLWFDGNTVDLGTLGGTQSHGRGINDAGLIVGDSQIAGDENFHAFICTVEDTNLTDLGAGEPNASSFACAINNHGVIVGKQLLPSHGGKSHAAMYVAGEWIDLQQSYFPTWDTSEALAINDKGWIVGYGLNADGNQRGWVLKLKYSLKSDLNKNGVVDFKDFAIVAEEWLENEPWHPEN